MDEARGFLRSVGRRIFEIAADLSAIAFYLVCASVVVLIAVEAPWLIVLLLLGIGALALWYPTGHIADVAKAPWPTRWFWARRFGRLKRAFLKGRGRLLFAGVSGEGKFTQGRTLLRETFVATAPGGEGEAAWRVIEAHPERLFLSLTCRCGAVYAIAVQDDVAGIHDRNARLGSFSDRYQGAWTAPWFRLSRERNELSCPACGKKVRPRVHLF